MMFIIPAWIVVFLAFGLLLDRIDKFRKRKPTNYLYLAKAVIDVYFIIAFTSIALDPRQFAPERAELGRTGLVLLLSVHLVSIIIERYSAWADIFVRKCLKKYRG